MTKKTFMPMHKNFLLLRKVTKASRIASDKATTKKQIIWLFPVRLFDITNAPESEIKKITVIL